MILQQGQTWEKDGAFIRIVHLERLAVDYKVMKCLVMKEGVHYRVTKKEFCRLIKGAIFLESPQPAPLDD